LVLIPKEEYEELKRAESPRVFKEVSMTKVQKRDLEIARQDYARGDFVTLDVLKHDMERRSSR
ncbi:MAG: hypothetical protein Q8R17_01330, partial [bacterium]|nr:hypothetical protein [bacterium]